MRRRHAKHAAMAMISIVGSLAGAVEAREPRRLSAGIAAYNKVEYTRALAHLEAALRQARAPEHLERTYFYLGCTRLALDQRPAAREMFETLLAIKPDYVPHRRFTSPKIARFFAEVRRSYATPDGPPSMSHSPPARASGRVTAITLLTSNLSPRLRPLLHYRSPDSPGFTTVEPSSRGVRCRFLAPTPSRGLRYYFTLADRRGIVIQSLGSSAEPFMLRARATRRRKQKTAWYKSWWFWTAAGVVVVGGAAVGIGVALSGSSSSAAHVTVIGPNGAPIFGQ